MVQAILRCSADHDHRVQNAFQQHGRSGVFSAIYGGAGSVGTSLVMLPRDALCSAGGIPRGTVPTPHGPFADDNTLTTAEGAGDTTFEARPYTSRTCSEAGCRQQ